MGFTAYRRRAEGVDAKRLLPSGRSEDKLRRVAELWEAPGPALSLLVMGSIEVGGLRLRWRALINLHLLTGQIARRGGRLLSPAAQWHGAGRLAVWPRLLATQCE